MNVFLCYVSIGMLVASIAKLTVLANEIDLVAFIVGIVAWPVLLSVIVLRLLWLTHIILRIYWLKWKSKRLIKKIIKETGENEDLRELGDLLKTALEDGEA
jgi:hypothetical protein